MANKTFAANWETLNHLESKGIKAELWENELTNSQFLEAFQKLKIFSNNWFLEGESDSSLFEGVSIGKCTSYMLFNDLESWIRVFLIFNSTRFEGSIFYLPNKEYFPEELYVYLKRANIKVNFIAESFDVLGVESTPKQLLSIKRTHRKFKSGFFSKASSILNIFKKTSSKNLLLLGSRNFNSIINEFQEGNRGIQLFIDPFFIGRRRVLPLLKNRNIKIISGEDLTASYDPNRLVSLGLAMFNKLSLLEESGSDLFCSLLKEYIYRMVKVQCSNILYLKDIITKNNITKTITMAHDSPESYIVKSLMDIVGGESYFEPHGLVTKEKNTYPLREGLAHKFFTYSKSEKETWKKAYNIDDANFFSREFISNRSIVKRGVPQNLRVLVLLDNFQVSLASRINYFQKHNDMIEMLKRQGFENITVRPHPSFFNYLKRDRLEGELISKVFKNVTIEDSRDIGLLESMDKTDVVIGPLTTSIYESIYSGVIFVPFVPEFFISEDIPTLNQIQWLPGLFPEISMNVSDLELVINDLKTQVGEFQKKYYESIKKLGVYHSKEDAFWSVIASD